jgi:AraC family ethanolamine operon transcriptional activator
MTATVARGTITTGSVEEHAQSTGALWNLDHTPLSAGGFGSRTVFVATPRVTVYRERWTRPLHVHGELRRDQIVFVLPEDSPRPFRLWGGDFVKAGVMPYAMSSAEVDFVAVEDYSGAMVILDGDFFAAVTRKCGLEGLGRGGFLVPDRVGSQRLRRLVHFALTSDENRFAATWPRVDLYEDELADALLAAIAPGRTLPAQTPHATTSLRAQVYRRCTEYAREKSFDVSVPDLCQIAGASRRTVEYAFLERLGVPPARFLRLCRYQRAFSVLASSARGDTTVSSLATSLGFSELGRFAVEYRKLYGERPSETLRRPPTAGAPQLPSPRGAG